MTSQDSPCGPDSTRESAAHPRDPSESLPSWPPQWPEIRESVLQAFDRGDWGRYQGWARQRLTERLSELSGVPYCPLISSGSLGVELALRFLGVGPGTVVALCGYDYPGNFRAIELLGARPLLVDAEQNGYSVCPERLAQPTDEPISVVLVSHLYGIPARIREIADLCKQRGWKLVEDACQTPLMPIDGRSAGAWGDVGVLSFGGSKPLTCGTGGALLTADERFVSKLNQWRERPSDCCPVGELQAAALLPQLDRLDDCNRLRGQSTRFLLERIPWLAAAIGPAVPDDQATLYKLAFNRSDRADFIQSCAKNGLPVGEGYRSMHRSSDRRCGKMGDLSRCRVLGEQLCLLDHAALLAEGQAREQLAEMLGQG